MPALSLLLGAVLAAAVAPLAWRNDCAICSPEGKNSARFDVDSATELGIEREVEPRKHSVVLSEIGSESVTAIELSVRFLEYRDLY
jgi:hypothetical protein